MTDIKVSVYCSTYNHKEYIRDALNGFLKQKTCFKFEIWIHDDASTDGTSLIVQEYVDKYPDIVHAVIQKENQYSKGVRAAVRDVFPRLKGKYIATCEGDDYWLDEYKLQKQVDFLDKNSEFSVCVHNTIKFNMKTNCSELMFFDSSNDREITLLDVILWGKSGFHVSSILCDANLFINQPLICSPSLDLQTAIIFALKGRIWFINEIWSFYRFNVKNSWTDRIRNSSDFGVKSLQYQIKLFSSANEYSHHLYDELFSKAISIKKYQLLMNNTEIREFDPKKFK